MENKTIRISLAAVLIYVIFEKTFDILAKGFIWLNRKLFIENEFLIISVIAILGIAALSVLFQLYNYSLKAGAPKKRLIYHLVFLASILVTGLGTMNYFYNLSYLGTNLANFQKTYVIQAIATNITEVVISVLGLIFFLLKIRNKDKTLASAF